MIGFYILCVFMIVFAIIGFIGIMIKISNQGKKDLLEKMYKNGDINDSIYRKYL